MKYANNSALFTDVSAEESSTVNGGVGGYRPVYRRRFVYNPYTGRYTSKIYIQWIPPRSIDIRYLQWNRKLFWNKNYKKASY